IGLAMPMTIRITNTTKRTGGRILPTRSTTFEGTIENNQVTTKNATDVHIGLLSRKEGSIPTSNVVAAVRGMAINGPTQIIMMEPRTGAIYLFIRSPRSLK